MTHGPLTKLLRALERGQRLRLYNSKIYDQHLEDVVCDSDELLRLYELAGLAVARNCAPPAPSIALAGAGLRRPAGAGGQPDERRRPRALRRPRAPGRQRSNLEEGEVVMWWLLRHPIEAYRAWRELRRNPPGLTFVLPLPTEEDLCEMREEDPE